MNPGTWNPRSYCRYGPSPCHFSPRSLRSLVGCGKEKVTTIWVRDEWGWREVTQEPNRRRTVQAGNWHLRFPTFIRSFLSSFRPLATGSCPSLGVRRSGTRRERRGKGHGRWCGVVSPSHSVSSLFLCDVGGAWRARVAKAMNDPSHPLT